MPGDSLGDRMKRYENAFRHYLPSRMPVIVRVDGRSFHTLTRHCERPWDNGLRFAMDQTAVALAEEVEGAVLAYVQSDEISLLLHNYKTLQTQPFFDNNLQKLVSITAAIASSRFTVGSRSVCGAIVPVQFDSRAFILPESEVANYFLWRQRDAERNSIQMLARSLYSHTELLGKGTSELQDMCMAKGKNWNDVETSWKRGRCVLRDANGVFHVDNEIPRFGADRAYVESHLKVEE